MNKAVIFCLFALQFNVFAKDFGVNGKTFEIKEANILEVIKASLTPDKVKEFQEKFKKEAIKSANRPKGIILPKAQEFRSFTFNPSVILQKDLKDHKGQVFAKKGQVLNPLKHISLSKTLILIDGDNKLQVEFALNFKGNKQIILTKGEVLNLSKKYDELFFFDFNASIVKKFGIKALPSIVFQNEEVLEINEIPL